MAQAGPGHVVGVGPEMFRLDGRSALITGGAGAIGSAIARGFAAAGAHVAVADRNAEATDALVSELQASNAEALALSGDVTDETVVDGMVARVMDRWGRLDVLVTAAGFGNRGPALDYDRARFEAILDLNVIAMFLCCRAAGRVMCAARRGSIINIASIAGLVGYPGNPAYLASKGGVVQLTRALAIEWAPMGVRVNAIAPGVIESPAVAAQIAKEPAFYDAFRAKHPIGRFGQPEIAGPALFLASDAASFVTGHILAADGGYVAQ
jgi:NAD(P)-dependent dehydrogenase (short-subunit alcohol dehydrogenase family)